MAAAGRPRLRRKRQTADGRGKSFAVTAIGRLANGDPTRPAPLTDLGREEARLLRLQLASVPLDLAVHTRFTRTRETLAEIVRDRTVTTAEEPLLDDIRIGDLERPERLVLVVMHEIPLRYALNAAAGSPELDGPRA